MKVDGFSIDDSASWSSENVFVAFHVLNHERIVMLYYRKYERVMVSMKRAALHNSGSSVNDAWIESQGAGGLAVSDIDAKLRNARTAIFSSARRMVQIFRGLRQRGFENLTPSFVSVLSPVRCLIKA